jgi:hypothetical protein
MRLAAFLCACAALACDGTSPSEVINLCRHQLSTWTAVAVGSEPMQRLDVGRTVRRGDPVVVADIRLDGSLTLLYVTGEQAAATMGCSGSIGAVTPTTGSVVPASVPGGGASISARDQTTFATGSFPNFQLLIAVKPFDLVARRSSDGKTIIRRGLSGNTIAPIDFNAEGFFPEPQSMTVTGGSASQIYQSVSYLVTAGGTTGLLGGSPLPPTSGSTIPVYTVPASQLVEGDLYFIQVTTENVRGVQFFSRNPAGRSVSIGGATNRASNAAGTVTLVSQSEYGAEVNVLLCRPQPASGPATMNIVATKGYFGGTPSTWTLPIPDLASLPDFPATYSTIRNWGACQTSVYDRPYGNSVTPVDGEIRRFASMLH